MITMKIRVDHRENEHIKNEIQKLGFDIHSEQLPVGDFVIRSTVVERKTVHDLLQSIIDKRLFFQLDRLKKFRNKLLIIEGTDDIYSLRDIHENAIRGALLSVALDYKIPIVTTKNGEDTARFLFALAKRVYMKTKREISLRNKKRTLSDEELQEYIVLGLPNVGPKLARELLKKFKTIENVFTSQEEDLNQVEKIGKKKAEKIRKILTKKYK